MGRNATSTVILGLAAGGCLCILAACGSRVIPGAVTSPNSRLAVADSGNGRVLLFDAPLSTDMNASAVLGMPDFTSSPELPKMPPTASSLWDPQALAMDASGNLYVTDPGANRVVQFQPPFANGMGASLELGEPSFTADTQCYSGPPAMTLCQPNGVAVDSNGNVWVSDTWDGRVLEYQAPIRQAMSPTLVIGQPDMNHTEDCDGTYIAGLPGYYTETTNATQLCLPGMIQFDRSGNLWVADARNSRVLEFVPPFSSGMAASLELGYPASVGLNSPTPWAQGYSCPSATPAPSSIFCGVGAIAFDAQGDLWVADYGRVLEFVPPFASGIASSLATGPQRDDGWIPPTASIMNGISGLALDPSGDLIVSDGEDNRVLTYAPPFAAGMGASVVIGQSNMTSSNPNQCSGPGCVLLNPAPSANTLSNPGGILRF
jgi:hypothetical protein